MDPIPEKYSWHNLLITRYLSACSTLLLPMMTTIFYWIPLLWHCVSGSSTRLRIPSPSPTSLLLLLLLSHFSRVWLSNPIDGSSPGSTFPGILQATILEWVAISLSNAWKWKVKVKLLSRVRLLATLWTASHQAPPSMGFSRQEYWSGVPLSSPTSFSSVQSLSCVRLFATPWIAAHQASLSITNSQSPLKLTSIELVMPTSHLILCHPLLLLPPIPPSIRVFSNESTLRMRWPKYWSSALASFLPKNTQGWPPLGWTGWISSQSKRLTRVFSNTTVQKQQFFRAQLSSQSNSRIHTWPL